MTEPITAEQLAEWRALVAKATPGPWISWRIKTGIESFPERAGVYSEESQSLVVWDGKWLRPGDADFMAYVRNNVAALLDEVERLRAAGPGIARLLAERLRQIESEGWSRERDVALYEGDDLARAAACYALPPYDRFMSDGVDSLPQFWPWGYEWWKPTDNRIRELEKAGALIAAEIDRLERLEVQP